MRFMLEKAAHSGCNGQSTSGRLEGSLAAQDNAQTRQQSQGSINGKWTRFRQAPPWQLLACSCCQGCDAFQSVSSRTAIIARSHLMSVMTYAATLPTFSLTPDRTCIQSYWIPKAIGSTTAAMRTVIHNSYWPSQGCKQKPRRSEVFVNLARDQIRLPFASCGGQRNPAGRVRRATLRRSRVRGPRARAQALPPS